MNYALNSALLYLISTVTDIFLYVLIIRLILVWVQANFFHPVTQFIVKATNWLITPTKRFLPNIKGIETASLLWLILIDMLKLSLLISLSMYFPNVLGVFVLAIADCLKLVLQTFIFAILIQFVISWIQPYSAANYLLQQFVMPILRPWQRLIPPISGIDISPIPALITLQLLLILIVQPLTAFANNIIF